MRFVLIAALVSMLVLAAACAGPVATERLDLSPSSGGSAAGSPFAFLALGVAAPAARANRMPILPFSPVERGAYRVRDVRTGDELEEAEWTLHQETRAGRLEVRLQEEGRETGESGGPALWSSHLRLDLRGPHLLLTSTRESRDGQDRPVQLEQREFNYDLGSGQVTMTEPGAGGKESRSIRLTPHAITAELLPALLRLLPEMKDRRMRFDLVTREGQMVGMRATVVGRETVRVPAGTFESFKVALEPTGLRGMLAAIDPPKIFIWHTVAAPHFWVKYQGPDGSSASRQIVRELVLFETEGVGAQPSDLSPQHTPREGGVSSLHPAKAPDGSPAPMPASLAYVFVLAVIVFEVGMEATRLLGL